MNEPQNFFKHADDDPDKVIAFGAWFMMQYPEVLKPGPVSDLVKRWIAELGPPNRPDKAIFLRSLDQPGIWQDTVSEEPG